MFKKNIIPVKDWNNISPNGIIQSITGCHHAYGKIMYENCNTFYRSINLFDKLY